VVQRQPWGHNREITTRIRGKRARRRAMEAPVTETLNPVKAYQQFIGGQWVDAASGETLDVENPATGEVVATVPASSGADVDRAVEAAATAFDSWSLTTPQTRSLALLKIADIIDEHADELGRLESSQTGKPTGAAIDEMTTSSDLFRFFAGACRVMEGLAVTEYLEGHTSMVRRDPVGVVASIAPWNYPLYMAAWKLGPALATGNTVVLKPSARTPLSALRFAELVSGELPEGVLNVLSGSGGAIGDLLVGHPKVRMVSITGDTVTGKHIAEIAAGTVKRLHLELGGKAPVIVFDDADVELAAEIIKSAGYWNSGQDCTAACRVIAGPAVYDKFVSALTDQVKSIKWGNPADADDLDMGSLIARAQADKVEGMVNRALDRAKLVVGGHRPDRPGAYFEPTIIANPDQKSEIIQDEVFGPVVTVQRFSDEEQAVRWANDVKFGLASSVFTGSISKAMRVARRLQFGTVWINEHFTLASETPHGGVKESGYGKDGSKYALEDYTTVKHITINTGI
jgi:aminobutyraldehyde dehydrogenase